MSSSLRFAMSVLAPFAAAAAQCPLQTVTSTEYGAGCSQVFGIPPTLNASLDAALCELVIALDADNACCNNYMTGVVFALGLQPTSLPLPIAGPGCTLLVVPDALVLQPGMASPAELHVAIPPALPPLTVFAQAAATYFTTVTFPAPSPTLFSITNGLAIDLQ